MTNKITRKYETDVLQYDGTEWRSLPPHDVFTMNGIEYVYVGKAIENALPPNGVVFGGEIYVPTSKQIQRQNNNSQNDG